MSSKRLTERQVRWSQLLSQFNFKLKFRAGKQGGRPDALSRRSQDIPRSLDDPRLKEREFRLLKSQWLPTANDVEPIEILPIALEKDPIPLGSSLFEDTGLQELWNRGVKEDLHNFQKLYRTMANNAEQFPTHLQLKVSRAECEIDVRGALCFRKRLWIPDWEPLQTAIIQKTHDSHLTGHPGRNSTLAMLMRSFYWPNMSKMVRRFCRNCDVCGRSHVWRSKRQGLLLPLPIPDRFHTELSIDFMTDLPVKEKDDPCYLMV
ncbi:hypothetical protein K3495_g16484, partial [Podosphaera aphanis]